MNPFAEPNTAEGNRSFVRLLLKQKRPVLSRVLEAVVHGVSREHDEACFYYDPEREAVNWMNELRAGREAS